MKNILLFLLMGLLGLTVSGKTWAAPTEEKEETKLQEEQREMDEAKPARTEQERVNELATQFRVPTGTVQGLRNQGQGWGEITIELAMADRLAKTDSKTYPTPSAALQKVESLRSSGEGWGKISQQLGFKLGPVISEAKEAREEFRERGRANRSDRREEMKEEKNEGKAERLERHERSEGIERPERFERMDRPERFERPERPERPETVHPER